MRVVDASVAVKWVFEEPGSRRARAILAEDLVFAAPRLWLVEAANVLRRKASEGRLTSSDVVSRIAFLRRLTVEEAEDASLLDAALDLSLRLDHALYDCLYLALALQRRLPLVTSDGKFAKAAQRHGFENLIQLIGPDQP